MTEVIRNNIQLWGVLFAWVVFGIYGGPAVYGIVLLSIFLFWKREMYAELLIGFWFILIMSDSLEYQMAWAKTLKNVYILLMGGILYVDRKEFAPFNRLFFKFVPFFFIAFVALYDSPVIGTGLQRTISYMLIFLIAPNFIIKIYKDRGPAIFKDILYLAFAVLAIGLAFKYIDPEVAISHGTRFRGIFGNPNGIGLFLIMVFILFYVVDNLYDLFSRNERLLFYGLVLVCVYMSGSRNALVSIALFLLFARVFRISVGFGFMMLIVFFFAYQVISANMLSIIYAFGWEDFLRVDSLESGSGRLVAWQFAWDNIQDSIMLGRGFSFDLHLMRSNFDELSRAGHEGGVHNSYLILWLNTGLIGIVLFFRAFILMFIAAAKRNPLAIPTMAAVMFSISFEPWLAASLNPYTIVFLMILTIFTEPIFEPVEEAEEGLDQIGLESESEEEGASDVILNSI